MIQEIASYLQILMDLFSRCNNLKYITKLLYYGEEDDGKDTISLNNIQKVEGISHHNGGDISSLINITCRNLKALHFTADTILQISSKMNFNNLKELCILGWYPEHTKCIQSIYHQ